VGEAAGIPEVVYEAAAELVGRRLAERGDRLVVVPDRGVALIALDAYLLNGGRAAIGLCPSAGVSEAAADSSIARNRARCHHVLTDLTWYEQHHAIGRLSDAMVCIGLSSGTIAEIAWTKWNGGPRTAAIGDTMSGIPPEIRAEVPLDVLNLDGLDEWLDLQPRERAHHPLTVTR
jgi:predicted Rossmann-fold nucleotide-binding protein